MTEQPRKIAIHRRTPWQGLLWPLLTLAGGFAAYFLLFRLLVDPLNPAIDAARAGAYRFLWEMPEPPMAAAIMAADVSARYAQAVPTVLMSLVFLAALVVALGLILPRFGRAAMLLGVVALPVGGAIGYLEQYNNPIRAAVANCRPGSGATFCPLDQAVARAGEASAFTEENLRQILLLTHWNSIISVMGIFLLGICFLFIARQAQPDELVPQLLRMRRQALASTVVLASLILVLSVATTNAFYHLAAAMMAPEDAKGMAALATAGATYWGAVYTTVMIVIAVPAAMSIVRDIRRAAKLADPDMTFAERRDWRARHGIPVDLRDALAPALASLAPVLTSPFLEALQGALAG